MEKEKNIEKMTKNKFNIVNIIAGINVILLIGLALLYIIYFSSPKKHVDGNDKTAVEKMNFSGEMMQSLVFVDSDKIINAYYLTEELKNEFEEAKNRLERQFTREYTRKQTELQQSYEKLQRDFQSGAISESDAIKREQDIMNGQQDLYALNETYTERLMTKEMDMQIQLTDSIYSFLKRYNDGKDYDFILGYARGGGILYANPQLDITDDVIKELDKLYSEK